MNKIIFAFSCLFLMTSLQASSSTLKGDSSQALKFILSSTPEYLGHIQETIKKGMNHDPDFYKKDFCVNDIACEKFVEIVFLQEAELRFAKSANVKEGKASKYYKKMLLEKLQTEINKEIAPSIAFCKNSSFYADTALSFCEKKISSKEKTIDRFMSFGLCYSTAILSCIK